MRHELGVLRLTVCHVELVHMLLGMLNVWRVDRRVIEHLLSGRLRRVGKLVLRVVHLCGVACAVGLVPRKTSRTRAQDQRAVNAPQTATRRAEFQGPRRYAVFVVVSVDWIEYWLTDGS